ncbi:unnamed protein product [Brachionus calyciflorus]|uniref:RRM domain-containing protein n=1 Tax=Brachionus calyciflorus TaxID=104777 RepID=A0A814CF72_9BILA|nr:unnamed protein product [Brachionus calyciflorus]
MAEHEYLIIFSCVVSGANNELNESDILNISTIIIDVKNTKLLDCTEYHIFPTNISSKSCENSNYISLLGFISKIDARLTNYGIRQNNLAFITDGPVHLRQIFIPECNLKNIEIPLYFFKYFDIIKEFKKFLNCPNFNGIDEIKEYMSLADENEQSSSMKQCFLLHEIVLEMIKSGYCFCNPEVISKELEKGIFSVDDKIEENTIVRVRGLPWQCTEYDVSKFFYGLNITRGGVALCLSQQGRRNGEALVRFENEEQRDLALRRHKHHMGSRYIEVYRASGKDFLSVAGGSNNEVKTFLTRNGKIIIRMRGLPFDSTAKDVVDFFKRGDYSCDIVDDEAGVLFVHYPDGRATGDAFVMFRTEEEASRATLKHKETMGPRYIELFRSTSAEVQQVFKRSQDLKYYQNNLKDTQLQPLPILPPEMISGSKKDCIRLKNLPLECGIEQVLEFLGVHSQHIVHQGLHMILNSQGQPSGEVFIQFDGEQSAMNVCLHKNKKIMVFMNEKYPIEVTQCSGEEMNLVLMGVLPSNLISQTINNIESTTNSYVPMCNPLSSIPNSNFYFSNLNTQIKPHPNHLPIINNQFSNVTGSYAPILWYYPTPPVSPSSTLFLHPAQMIHSFSNPIFLVLKNAPSNITVNDVLEFFNGYEIMADSFQIQNNSENGLNSSDVLITLHNRLEAERAVVEKNHQKIGNNLIELYLSI